MRSSCRTIARFSIAWARRCVSTSKSLGSRAGRVREAARGSGAKSASRRNRLSRVVDRFRKEEQHAADRREQREGDDAALRLALAGAHRPGNAEDDVLLSPRNA